MGTLLAYQELNMMWQEFGVGITTLYLTPISTSSRSHPEIRKICFGLNHVCSVSWHVDKPYKLSFRVSSLKLQNELVWAEIYVYIVIQGEAKSQTDILIHITG